MQRVFAGESKFLETRCFLWWIQFFISRGGEQAGLQDVEFSTSRNCLRFSAELSDVNGPERNLRNWCNWPLLLDDCKVAGDRCKSKSQYYLFPMIASYSYKMILEQDETFPHYAIPFRQYLDETSPNRRVESGGPISWPVSSPDLVPCDFFL